jgi:hypothetical protein
LLARLGDCNAQDHDPLPNSRSAGPNGTYYRDNHSRHFGNDFVYALSRLPKDSQMAPKGRMDRGTRRIGRAVGGFPCFGRESAPPLRAALAQKRALRCPREIGTIAKMGTRGRYSIMLFRDGGESSGIEVMIDSDDRLDAARALYEREIMKRPGRLVMLCDRARVLARSDRPETMPI